MRSHQRIAEDRRRLREERNRAGLCISCGLHPVRENRRTCVECGLRQNTKRRVNRKLQGPREAKPENIQIAPNAWYLTFDAGCPTQKRLYW